MLSILLPNILKWNVWEICDSLNGLVWFWVLLRRNTSLHTFTLYCQGIERSIPLWWCLEKKERCQWVFERENERFISLQHLVFSPTQVVIQTVTSLWKAFTETLMHLLLLNEFSDLCLVQKYPSIRHNISTNTTRTTTFLCKIMFNAVLPFCLSPWKKSVEAPKKQI